MKPSEIKVLSSYRGRNGSVREVTGEYRDTRLDDGDCIRWRLVERAKHPHHETGEPREHGAHIGETGRCTRAAMASWAKALVEEAS